MPSLFSEVPQPRFSIRQNGVYQQVSRLPPSAHRKPPNSLHGLSAVEAMQRGPLSRAHCPLEFRHRFQYPHFTSADRDCKPVSGPEVHGRETTITRRFISLFLHYSLCVHCCFWFWLVRLLGASTSIYRRSSADLWDQHHDLNLSLSSDICLLPNLDPPLS